MGSALAVLAMLAMATRVQDFRHRTHWYLKNTDISTLVLVIQVTIGVASALAVLAMATKVQEFPPPGAPDRPLLGRPDYVSDACKASGS